VLLVTVNRFCLSWSEGGATFVVAIPVLRHILSCVVFWNTNEARLRLSSVILQMPALGNVALVGFTYWVRKE
jgi:hypothetical protein